VTYLGERAIKGYDRALEVFAVVRSVASPRASGATRPASFGLGHSPGRVPVIRAINKCQL